MPTPTEVEERLRRTAAACEPIVEDLLAGGDLPAPVALPPHRRRVAPWLVAAAAVGALAVAALVVPDGGDGADVRTSESSTLDVRTTTTSPEAANPLLATDVLLPDGTSVVLGIPGPDRWSAAVASVDVELATVEGEPVTIGLQETTLEEVFGDEGVVEREIGPGAVLIAWGGGRWLAVEVDGWTATMPVTLDGFEVVPDEVAVSVAGSLGFRVTPDGPVDVTAEGMTVVGTARRLTAGGDALGIRSAFDVRTAADAADLRCPSTSWSSTRCLLDGTLAVEARGPLATVVLPGVEAWSEGESVPAEVLPADPTPMLGIRDIALLDGTHVELTLPAMGQGWVVGDGRAEVDLGPRAVPVTVPILSTTVDVWAGEHDAEITAVERPGETRVALGTTDQGRSLLVERRGWLAVVPLEADGDPILTDAEADALAAAVEMDVDEAGPVELRATGLVVTTSERDVDNAALGTLVVRTGALGGACDEPQARCFAGGVAVIALHSKAAQALPTLDAVVTAHPR